MASTATLSSKYQVPSKLFKRLGEDSAAQAMAGQSTTINSMRSLVVSPRSILNRASSRQLGKAVSTVLNTIPKILRECVDYLLEEDRINTEGLFRIAGDNDNVDKLLNAFENTSKFGSFDDVLNDAKASPHDVATLLKRYLMKMAAPLIDEPTKKELITIVDKGTSEDKDKQLIAYEVVVRCLEIESDKRLALAFLLQFLLRVGTTDNGSKMNVKNLAMVFAPIIFREDEESTNLLMEQKRLIDLSITVCEILIWNAQEIVPK